MNIPTNPHKAWDYVPAVPVVPADSPLAKYKALFKNLGRRHVSATIRPDPRHKLTLEHIHTVLHRADADTGSDLETFGCLITVPTL